MIVHCIQLIGSECLAIIFCTAVLKMEVRGATLCMYDHWSVKQFLKIHICSTSSRKLCFKRILIEVNNNWHNVVLKIKYYNQSAWESSM